jgi:uncharacterized repeat protein (TIGR03803 family)
MQARTARVTDGGIEIWSLKERPDRRIELMMRDCRIDCALDAIYIRFGTDAGTATLFNFRLSPGRVTGILVQGPDGNFYGTTAQGGPMGNGTVYRVTPAGVLTTLVSDQINPVAGIIPESVYSQYQQAFRRLFADLGSLR